jgi:hypothetical protein
MAIDVTQTRRSNYNVSWNSIDLGGVNKVDLSKLELLLEPVKIGSLGNMKLDDRFIGLKDESIISVEIRQVTRTIIEKLVPWFSGSTGALVPLVPPVNTLIGTYAQILLLHPRDVADVSQDVKLYKTVPIQAFNLTRDGTKDDVWEIMFMIYPDITKLPNNPYGEIVAAP